MLERHTEYGSAWVQWIRIQDGQNGAYKRRKVFEGQEILPCEICKWRRTQPVTLHNNTHFCISQPEGTGLGRKSIKRWVCWMCIKYTITFCVCTIGSFGKCSLIPFSLFPHLSLINVLLCSSLTACWENPRKFTCLKFGITGGFRNNFSSHRRLSEEDFRKEF